MALADDLQDALAGALDARHLEALQRGLGDHPRQMEHDGGGFRWITGEAKIPTCRDFRKWS